MPRNPYDITPSNSDSELLERARQNLATQLGRWREILDQQSEGMLLPSPEEVELAELANQRTRNRQKLLQLSEPLPKMHRGMFETDNLYTVRAIQANCLWHDGSELAAFSKPAVSWHGAYFIIGQRFGQSPTDDIELLLLDARADQDAATTTVKVSAKTAAALQQRARDKLIRPPQPEDFDMADTTRQTFRITVESPGVSILYAHYRPPCDNVADLVMRALGYPGKTAFVTAAKLAATIKGDRYVARSPDSVGSRMKTSREGLTDAEWKTYKLDDYLGSLVTIFTAGSHNGQPDPTEPDK